MSKLIKKHAGAIPDLILWLLDSVIETRTQAHDAYLSMTSGNNDPDLDRKNDSHKKFILFLREAFNILGGEAWLRHRDTGATDVSSEGYSTSSNKFEALVTGSSNGSGEESQTESDKDEPGPCVPRMVCENNAKERTSARKKPSDREHLNVMQKMCYPPPTFPSSPVVLSMLTATQRTGIWLPSGCLPT